MRSSQLILISRANQIPGSQTGSQRSQTPGDVRRRPATIRPANWHFRRHRRRPATVRIASYKRGVRRFKSYCAHNFRILDSACRSAKPRSRRHTLPEWGKSGAASRCRERMRHVPVLLGMEVLARQPRPWSATGCTTKTTRIASHRSPARSPTGSTSMGTRIGEHGRAKARLAWSSRLACSSSLVVRVWTSCGRRGSGTGRPRAVVLFGERGVELAARSAWTGASGAMPLMARSSSRRRAGRPRL